MKKKITISLLAVALVLFLLTSNYFEQIFGSKVIDYLVYPFLWSLLIFIVSIFAISLNDQKHKTWLKFTGIFFVVSMFLVFRSPEYDGAIVSFDRESVNWLLASVYSIISIGYFIVQFIKNRK